MLIEKQRENLKKKKNKSYRRAFISQGMRQALQSTDHCDPMRKKKKIPTLPKFQVTNPKNKANRKSKRNL